MCAKYAASLFVCFGVLLLPEMCLCQSVPPKQSDEDSQINAEIAAISNIEGEVQHHNAFVKQMIEIVDSDAAMRVRSAAASALRDLRAKEAVPVLTKDLVVVTEAYRSSRDMIPHLTGYPCALALVDIGEAAISPLLERLMLTRNKFELETCTYVILAILGKDRAMAELDISRESNHSSIIRESNRSPFMRENLSEAIKIVQNYKED